MGDKTKIEWTDATWNPVTGCTKVSPGCEHCYIDRTPPFRIAGRRFDREGISVTTGVQLHPERLDQPLRWRSPRRIFVCSLADPFHNDVPDEYIARVWAAMALAERHTFQVLTKRPARMRALLRDPGFKLLVWAALIDLSEQLGQKRHDIDWDHVTWPLPNVWVGTTAEDQKRADQRIPILLDTPAAVRWLSVDPMLGRVDLRDFVDQWDDESVESCDWGGCERPAIAIRRCRCFTQDHPMYVSMLSVCELHRGIDWVVCGGESGPGARRMHPDWPRSLRDQCIAAGVPFLFKQWGEHDASGVRVGKRNAGRVLDGRTWDEYPPQISGGAL